MCYKIWFSVEKCEFSLNYCKDRQKFKFLSFLVVVVKLKTLLDGFLTYFSFENTKRAGRLTVTKSIGHFSMWCLKCHIYITVTL